MLVVDPMKRITIPEIRQHPWFQHKLPQYLHFTPDMLEQQEKVLDVETAEEVALIAALRTDRDQVALSVMTKGGRQDVRVAYELILDSKRSRQRAAEVAMAQQAAAASTPPAFSSSGGTSPSQGGTPPSMASHAQQAHHQQRAEQATAALTQRASGGGGAGPAPTPSGGGASQGAAASRRRRWYLGIQSKKEPAHVMTEVYKALAVLGCEWHIIDSYVQMPLPCRCVRWSDANSATQLSCDFACENSCAPVCVCARSVWLRNPWARDCAPQLSHQVPLPRGEHHVGHSLAPAPPAVVCPVRRGRAGRW
jgi:5'-AMP-activated protein kinase catalytic alpha subunit